MGETMRAEGELDLAEKYYQESLDYTSQVLSLQKRRLWIMILLLAAMALMACATVVALRLLKRTTIEKKELTAITAVVANGLSEWTICMYKKGRPIVLRTPSHIVA